MKTKLFIGSIIVLLLACQQNTKKKYYKTGELMYETYDVDKKEGVFHVKEYYRNGVLKKTGDCKDVSNRKNLPIGQWKEYYSDGVLKWSGVYRDGVLQQSKISNNTIWPDIKHLSKDIDIEGKPDSLILGQSYKIRLLMPSIHPRMYVVVDRNFKELKKNPNDFDRYTYIITPNIIGNFYIMIVFQNKNGDFLVGNPTMVIELKVKR